MSNAQKRDEQYRLADSAAERGDGVKMAEHTRRGRAFDAASMVVDPHCRVIYTIGRDD